MVKRIVDEDVEEDGAEGRTLVHFESRAEKVGKVGPGRGVGECRKEGGRKSGK